VSGSLGLKDKEMPNDREIWIYRRTNVSSVTTKVKNRDSGDMSRHIKPQTPPLPINEPHEKRILCKFWKNRSLLLDESRRRAASEEFVTNRTRTRVCRVSRRKTSEVGKVS
jgi:hypothetical protein